MIDGVRMCFVMLHSSLCLDVFIVLHVWLCSLCYMIGCVSSCFIDTYVSIMLAKIPIFLFTSFLIHSDHSLLLTFLEVITSFMCAPVFFLSSWLQLVPASL